MAFDNKAFAKAKFEQRTGVVPVPFLKDFFIDSEPEFKVRGLDIYEFAAVKEANAKNKNIDNLIAVLLNDQEQIAALKEAVGLSNETVSGEIAGRFEAFKIGVIYPEFDHQTMLIFAKRFPIDFWTITQKIFELTGQGMEIKKQLPSGEIQK